MIKLVTTVILLFSGVVSVAYFAPQTGGYFGHDHDHGRGPGHVSAPEIDPSSAMTALTLLLGGVTVLRSRIAKK